MNQRTILIAQAAHFLDLIIDNTSLHTIDHEIGTRNEKERVVLERETRERIAGRLGIPGGEPTGATRNSDDGANVLEDDDHGGEDGLDVTLSLHLKTIAS
ncbi:hypothetical protein Tco_1466075 [Tanacetum coccineum]